MKPATSSDVAQLAGVSRSTVSYVLGGNPDVRITEATRARVLEAAATLGYQPSAAARALRRGRGTVVLLLLPNWETAGELGLLLNEIGRTISLQGLLCLRYEGAQWQDQLSTVLTLVPAAAVVTFQPLGPADASALSNAGIPEIPAWLVDQPDRPHTTRIHQRDIVRAQVDHVLERGYRRLVYAYFDDPRNDAFIQARIRAFTEITQRLREVKADLVVLGTEPGAVVTMLRSRAGDDMEPLAVCAWSDVAGLAVLSAARELGLRVPQDLAVAGVDDSPVARHSDPPLTSVAFDLTQEATAVTQGVCRALDLTPPSNPGGDDPVTITVRRST